MSINIKFKVVSNHEVFYVFGVQDHNLIVISGGGTIKLLNAINTKIDYYPPTTNYSNRRKLCFTDATNKIELEWVAYFDSEITDFINWHRALPQGHKSRELQILEDENKGLKLRIQNLEREQSDVKPAHSSNKNKNNHNNNNNNSSKKLIDLEATQKELEITKNHLKSVQQTNESTQKELELTRNHLKSAHQTNKSTLETSQHNQSIIQKKLDAIQRQFEASEKENEKLQIDLKSTQRKLDSAQRQLETSEKTIKTQQIHYEETQKDYQSLKRQDTATKQALQHLEEKNAELEKTNNASVAQISALSVVYAKLGGMHVDSQITATVNVFKELRDNDLVNLVFNLTDNNDMQDILFSLISKLAFHNFWSTVCTDEKVSRETKIKYANQILEREETVHKIASHLTNAAINALVNHSFPIQNDLPSLLRTFFASCALWNAKMTLCDPALELLPKDYIPKKGTLLNYIHGQQFDLDFEGYGYPVVDTVMPGLMVNDFNKSILVKGQIKCHFPTKK